MTELAGSENDCNLLISDLYKSIYGNVQVDSSAGDLAIENMKYFFQIYPPKWTSNGLDYAKILTKGLPPDKAAEITTYDKSTLRKKKKIGPKEFNKEKKMKKDLIDAFLDDSKAPENVSLLTQEQAFPFSRKYVFFFMIHN